MTSVLALGTFDLVHPGHVAFLLRCKEAVEPDTAWLTVALNTDEFAGRFKRPPILTLEERTSMISALDMVDEVIVNEGCEDARPAILRAEADMVVHGDDWTGDSYMQQLGVTDEWLTEHGVEIRYVPYTAGISTTEIIRRIRNDYLLAWREASRCPRCGENTTWSRGRLAPDVDAATCDTCGEVSSGSELSRGVAQCASPR